MAPRRSKLLLISREGNDGVVRFQAFHVRPIETPDAGISSDFFGFLLGFLFYYLFTQHHHHLSS
jgi:hypothetical protein